MATYRKYGEKCPAYDCWNVEGDKGYTCKGCDGCVSMDDAGVECSYSPIPTTIPKYKIGDVLWRSFYCDCYNQAEVRKVEYDGKFQWMYTFKRERISRKEKNVFKTRQEVDEYLLKKHFKELLDEIVEYKQMHMSLPNFYTKLLDYKNI